MKLLKLLPIVLIVFSCDQNKTDNPDDQAHSGDTLNEADSSVFYTDPFNHLPVYLNGILGKDLRIRMKIGQSAGGGMSGTYYYENIGVPIDLIVTSIEESGNWVIDEYSKDKKTGTWQGKIDNGRFSGTWTGANGSTYPFNLEISPNETSFLSGLKPEGKKLDPEAVSVLDQCIDGSALLDLTLTDSVMDEWESEWIYLLSEEQWNKLDKKTKLLHCFKYPESFEQICAESPDAQPGMLYDQLPFNTSGASMSGRQYQFVENNRDFTIKQISNCISRTHKMDVEYYWILSNLDATEMIPQLVSHYREGHLTETAVLTLLIHFMNEYDPYKEWASEIKLFEPKEETGEDLWYGFYRTEPLTEEIENGILDLAEDFYVGQDIS